MIISVMGAKGIRQYDLSRYPKIMLIVSAMIPLLILFGIGVGMGWMIHPVPNESVAQTVAAPQAASDRKVVATLRDKVQDLQQQLAEARHKSQAPPPHPSADPKILTELRARVQQLLQQLADSRQKYRSVHRQFTALQSRHPSAPESAPTATASAESSHQASGGTGTDTNTSESADTANPYRLLAQHPLALDWLKLSDALTTHYTNLPKPNHPSPVKLARTEVHGRHPSVPTKPQTWGTDQVLKGKAKLLHQSKPFDRPYRRRVAISRIARAQLGKHYVWGAVGPKTFDCSGFTSYVYRKLGIHIPRTSRMQARYGKRISRKDLRPGDLIFFDTSRNRRGYVNHVGIYIGNNRFIHASSARKRVIITNLNKTFYSQRFKWARRITN